MRQRDVFRPRGEDQRVLPHHLPAAQRRKPDRAGLARPRMPVPAALDHIIQPDAAPPGHRPPDADRRSGRRVHLLPMVHLHDLGVVGIGRQCRTHPFGQRQHQVDPGGEVRRIDHGNVRGGRLHRGFVVPRQAGGPEDPGLAGGSHRRGGGSGGRGMGEVDHHVRRIGERRNIRKQPNTRRCRLGRTRSAQAAGEDGAGGSDLLDQQLSHAAGDAGDADACGHGDAPWIGRFMLAGFNTPGPSRSRSATARHPGMTVDWRRKSQSRRAGSGRCRPRRAA